MRVALGFALMTVLAGAALAQPKKETPEQKAQREAKEKAASDKEKAETEEKLRAACIKLAEERATRAQAATAIYLDGVNEYVIKGDESSMRSGPVIYYARGEADLKRVQSRSATPRFEAPDKDCKDLRSWTRTGRTALQYAKAFRSPAASPLTENGATSIATEAVQILGQIVVDRASTAAYAMLSSKVKTWLKCNAETPFKATCEVVGNLRLQDLAMAPDLLRGALAKDALAYVDILKKKVIDKVSVAPSPSSGPSPMRVVLGANTGGSADPCADQSKARDVRCTIQRAIETHILPSISRPVSDLIGHSAESAIRDLVSRGLDKLEDAATNGYCKMDKDRDRILALSAASFAACHVEKGEASTPCSIMQFVEQIDGECDVDDRLLPEQLSSARSIAGHFWAAVNLNIKNAQPDHAKRILSALEGSFEVACMYAVENAAGPFTCEIDPVPIDPQTKKIKDLTPAESVAIARDTTLAAATRNGASFAAAFVRALARMLPADHTDYSRGLRVLATITAYASTYTDPDESADKAHSRRTELLESLTADMTQRTDRAGDTILALGGSLRLVGGVRIGNKDAGKRDKALWTPLSLPLGFSLDCLGEKSKHGFHMELSVLDLGQYLTWENGPELAEPSLGAALSPSITLAYAYGRELPFIVGATAGYTPTFDFDSDVDTDEVGAWNVGLTLGVYVPLFDFN
ncbi:MAG: hypothetical protein AB7T06_18850 [Kofleriaceae bacterium]